MAEALDKLLDKQLCASNAQAIGLHWTPAGSLRLLLVVKAANNREKRFRSVTLCKTLTPFAVEGAVAFGEDAPASAGCMVEGIWPWSAHGSGSAH
jgi:hypothetical protein